jgi:hypothetical protein
MPAWNTEKFKCYAVQWCTTSWDGQINIDLGIIETSSGSQFDLAKHIFGTESVLCMATLRKWVGLADIKQDQAKFSYQSFNTTWDGVTITVYLI